MEQQNIAQSEPVDHNSFSEDPGEVKRSLYNRIPTLCVKIPPPYFAPTAWTRAGFFKQMKKVFQQKLYAFEMQLKLDQESIELLVKEDKRINDHFDKVESADEQTKVAMERECVSAVLSKKAKDIEDLLVYIEAYKVFIHNFHLYV